MLHDWSFPETFGRIHLDHAAVYLAPIRYRMGYIVQDRTVFGKGPALESVNASDTSRVEVRKDGS